MSTTTIPAPLNQGWGYGVTLGVGFAFAAAMAYISLLLKRHNGEDNSHFETYATAGRKIGTGLTATAVIASWAWSTAILSSSVVTYNYGVAGAWWFASGCLVQICAFALLAIQSKLKTPHAHTVLEVVKVRYGTTAHWLYIFLCLANNLIAIANMLLGASAAISSLTGMAVEAATFLLPVGVVFYTITGGLKATFVTDWLHTVALLIIVVYLSLKTLTHPAIGSPENLMALVRTVSDATPVSGNRGGSYFTMASSGATSFGILHTLGNFGLVAMDSSYWQKAYSADVAAAVPGYLLGGILYFAMPWALGTILGLAGIALGSNPIWPTFGRTLSDTELNQGLIVPYAALATAGKGGAVAVVIIIFMAVTSTTSAQLVAVSSIVSSDIFHTYIRPNASDRQIINVSRGACIGFALFASAFSVMLYEINLSLTWTLYFLGIITCPGMITLPLTVLWKKQTWAAAVVSPVVGMIAGIIVWLTTASKVYGNGVLNVTTTGALMPCLWGTITAAFVPAILSPTITYLFPRPEFDWERFNDIKLVSSDSDSEVTKTPTLAEKVASEPISPQERRYMQKRSHFAAGAGIFLFFAVWVIPPFSMFRYDFSPRFFAGWVSVALIWAFLALLIVTFLPPIEGRVILWKIIRGAFGQLPAVAPISSHRANDSEKVEQEPQTAVGTPEEPDSPKNNKKSELL